MLLTLVQLFSDERLARFFQYPLLGQRLTSRIIPEFEAGGQTIDVFHEMMIKERYPSLDGM